MRTFILCLFLTGCQVDHEVKIEPVHITVDPIELFICIDGWYWWVNGEPITLNGQQLSCEEQ